MRKRIVTSFIFIFVVLIALVSCVYGTNNFLYKGNKVDNRIDYIHEIKDVLPPNTEFPSKYRILVLADVHVGSPTRDTDIAPLIAWLKRYKIEHPDDYPLFGLSLGDLVDHGTKEEYEKYCSLMNQVENEGIHIINVLGNHDLYASGWEHYQKMCYPNCSLFKFESKNFSWYGIDTGTGDVGIKQYNILKDAFKNDKRPKIILMHYPLSNTKRFGFLCLHDPTERNLLIDLFAQNDVKAALCGHLHQTQDADLQLFMEYGNPSYLYSENGWTIFEIDENRKSVIKVPIETIANVDDLVFE